MLVLSEESEEVYYLKNNYSLKSDIHEFLINKAILSKRSRCRLCLHNNPSAINQEMIICLLKDSNIPIHAHVNKEESFKIEKGFLKYSIFDKKGNVLSEKFLDSSSDKVLVPVDTFHSFKILSSFAIFREWTKGPFSKNETRIIS